jgi:hypothetical protein
MPASPIGRPELAKTSENTAPQRTSTLRSSYGMIGLIVGASRFSTLPSRSRSVVPPEDLQRFLDTFLYREQAVFVDEISRNST